MTLSFDPKEELRLRMADLEKKLAESEEERCKLEKTCNVLMRAFKEEEKIRYKTLNKNYEKFLQDCTARKRRNNIILKSLYRIEDRSRALFAKTERLKLLKDRYISYLKISDIKDGISSHTWRTLPLSSLSQKTTSEVTPKLVQWKNPLAADHKVADLKDVEENSSWSSNFSEAKFYNFVASHEKYSQEQTSDEISRDNEVDVINGLSRIKAPARSFDAQNKLYSVNARLDSSLSDTVGVPVKTEKLAVTINREKPENYGALKKNISNELEVKDLVELPKVSKGRNNMSHQESIEKLKKALSFEEELIDNENIDERDDLYDKKVIEKDDVEQNEKNPVKKQNNSRDATHPRINHYSMTSGSSISEEEKQDTHAHDVGMQMKTGTPEGNLPMGLDGVDYQNETYPESYYEQPVHHHNSTSIVADVILEEDETEQDVDEEEENPFDEAQLLKDNTLGSSTWKESPGQKTDKLPDRSKHWSNATIDQLELTNKVRDMTEKVIDEVKSQEFNSEKVSEGKSSDVGESDPKSEKSERLAAENLDTKKNVRSNLIHLLESDSESFQIEHGDAVSGNNEDSDFDFSFH